MDDEIRSHIEMQTQENIDAGMTREQARTSALRPFGGMESVRATCREQRGVSWVEDLGQDLRFGARMLMKNRGFTAGATVTLGLGIGANTVVFSLAKAVLLRSLSIKAPEKVVWLQLSDPGMARSP